MFIYLIPFISRSLMGGIITKRVNWIWLTHDRNAGPHSSYILWPQDFGAHFKIKYLLYNNPTGDNGCGSGEKNNYRCKKKCTNLYFFLGHHLHPYITYKTLHKIHQTYDYQINEGLNNMFARYAPKNSTFSTTMNLSTHILLAIEFYSCGYKYVFTKLYSLLGV